MESEKTCVSAEWTRRCVEALLRRDPSLPADIAAELASQMAALGVWREADPGGAVSAIFGPTAATSPVDELMNSRSQRSTSFWSV